MTFLSLCSTVVSELISKVGHCGLNSSQVMMSNQTLGPLNCNGYQILLASKFKGGLCVVLAMLLMFCIDKIN